jgi:chromosome segregation ATPase
VSRKTEDDLEPTMPGVNGGVTPRCHARSKGSGEQCKKPARRGYGVCSSHGAGTAKREAAGERKNPGRPVTHGLYSKTSTTSLQALREEVAALETDLDDTDGEMTTLRAILWFLLEQAERFSTKAETLETALEAVEGTLEAAVIVKDGAPTGTGELTVAQARQLGGQLAQGHKLIAEISSWTAKLLESNFRYVIAVKARAETASRLAQTKAVEAFLRLAQLNRNLIHELAPNVEFLDAYELRLQKELFGPNRLEAPANPRTPPEEMN